MTKTLIPSDTFQLVPLSKLVPAEDNVRDEIGDVDDLAASIRQVGLQSPLRVQAMDDGTYRIVAGHRRHAALMTIADGKYDVPCMVVGDLGDDLRVASMIVENLQRTDLNPIEEAHAFLRLTGEFKYKQADLAQRIGKSTSYVSQRLSLLKLPDVVVDQIRAGELPLGVALELAKIGDDATVLTLTNNGKRVPAQSVIDDHVNQLNSRRLRKRFEDKLEALGVRVTTDRIPVASTKVVFEADDPKQLDELTKIPKNAVAYLQVEPWRGRASVSIRREMTDAEIAKAKEEADAKRAELQSQYEKDRAEAEAKRLADLDPVLVEWEAECNRLKAEHKAAVAEFDDKQFSAIQAWVKSVNAKDAARWAMLTIVADAGDAFHVAGLLGLDRPEHYNAAKDAIIDFACESAANLAAAVTAALLSDYDQDAPGDLFEKRDEYLAKHNLLNYPDEPTLPARPELADAAA